MARCIYCGNELEPNARFCVYCGRTAPVPEAPAPEEKKQTPKKVWPTALLVALITALLTTVLVGGYFLFFQPQKTQTSAPVTVTAPQTPEPESKPTAEEIYDLCSPAVFYVEVYDKNDRPFATGSGFFLDADGIAITNYHVIEDACSAKILTSDDKSYKVEGLLAWDKEEDWAVIRVKGSDFATLSPAETAAQTGQTVYAIGSPLGLQNTISEGLVSNASQEVDGQTYIQTSAAISHGSSGGALLDEVGNVLGITSAGFTDGQNLGLAIPIEKVLNKDLSTLTTLDSLFGKAPSYSGKQTNSSLSRTEVLNRLYEWIQTNANDEVLGYPAACFVEEEEDNSIYVTTLFYHEEKEFFVFYYDYYTEDDSVFSTILVVYPESTECMVKYTYYVDSDDEEPYFKGYTTFDAENFSLEGMLEFDEYEGNTTSLTDHQELGNGLVALTLGDLELVFLSDPEFFGGCSLADLGFTSLYN